MFARKNSKVALTFLCLVVALGLATVSEANSLVHTPRDHASLNRMIKKRTPQDGGLLPIIPVIGAEGTSASASTDSAASLTQSVASSATQTNIASNPSITASTNSASVSSTSDTASASNSASLSSTSASASASSSASSTSSSQSSSSTSSSSGVSSTSSTSEVSVPTQDPVNDTPSSTHTSTKFITATDSSAASASSGASITGASSDNNSSGKITRTTLTVIIVIAASVGFIALAWTLFRKWKLRPSSNFDDRMQPIDWQPSGPDDSGLPNHRRANSAASHGSFHSSGHGHGGLEALPEHDFTAGPSALAPVGGYADLHRGPSPQPMAQLHRGPSATRADYNAYDYNGMRY